MTLLAVAPTGMTVLPSEKEITPDLDNAFETVKLRRCERDQYCESCGYVLPEGEMGVLYFDKPRQKASIWHRICFARRRF